MLPTSTKKKPVTTKNNKKTPQKQVLPSTLTTFTPSNSKKFKVNFLKKPKKEDDQV